jgi:hypothetical protein
MNHHLTEQELSTTWFELAWASPGEIHSITRELERLGRQTMNVRLMSRARFVILKNNHGDAAGWAGLDISYQAGYPELFSLYLREEYRKYSLGLLIESVRAAYLLSQNIRVAYVRMTKDESFAGLMRRRLESQFYSVLRPDDLKPSYKDLCRQCELFGKSCPEQVFLKFDVVKFMAQSDLEIGPVSVDLPKRFRLTPRLAEAKQKVSGGDCEKGALHWKYRPTWLGF